MYADGSTMCNSAKTVQEVNQVLTENSKPLYEWIDKNSMVLNIPKTRYANWYCPKTENCYKSIPSR